MKKGIPTKVSDAVKLRNPGIYGHDKLTPVAFTTQRTMDKHAEKLKAANGPASVNLSLQKTTDEERLNKLERAWLSELRLLYPAESIGIQNITLKLADDCRYTADFNVINAHGELVFFETKGPQFWEDAKIKLKVVARQFRYFRFVLVRRIDGQWREEDVKP